MDDFFGPALHAQRSQLQSAQQEEEAEDARRIKEEAPEAVKLFIRLCLEDMKTAFARDDAQYHIPMWDSKSPVWQEVEREHPHGHQGMAEHELEIARRISDTTGRIVQSGAPGLVLIFDSSTAQKREATLAITDKVLAGIADMKTGKVKLYEGLSKADEAELKQRFPLGVAFVEPHDVISVVEKTGEPTWRYNAYTYAVILPKEEKETKGKVES